MVDNNHQMNAALNADEKYKTAVENAKEYLENFDILETITNVGNDEVFTPRRTVDILLDSLPEEVWHNPKYKWLNPATKNGIFEREIAIRLDIGLKDIIKDDELRKKHILQDMIFAFGQTKFTSNVARRTLYYCSQANRKCDGVKAKDGHYINGYAIGNGLWFEDAEGNIKTPCTDHEYIDSKNRKMPISCSIEERKKYHCKYCGISGASTYNDINQREKYAYEFLHVYHLNIERYLQERFFKGDKNMKFDIIIGNPPYQLSDGGAQASAKPIYNLFVEKAISLNPKYISMIIPSRWMIGGKGLDEFRKMMINDKRISQLHDFLNAKDCFPNNEIKGGVCFFLWESEYNNKCLVTTKNNSVIKKTYRYLKEGEMDIFVRDETLVDVHNKVKRKTQKTFDSIVSASKPYGFRAETMLSPKKYKLPPFSETKINDGYEIFGLGDKQKRTWKYLSKDYPLPKISKCLHKYKVFIAEAYGSGAIGEAMSVPVLAYPGQLCTETFLEVGPFENEVSASNAIKYIKTRFFRALVSIQKQTQHTTQKVYRFVPMQDFTSNSDIDWSKEIFEIDLQLQNKYKLNDEEKEFIRKNIQEMN